MDMATQTHTSVKTKDKTIYMVKMHKSVICIETAEVVTAWHIIQK